MCFTIDERKKDNTLKEEMKANNAAKIFLGHVKHFIEKHEIVFFEIKLER